MGASCGCIATPKVTRSVNLEDHEKEDLAIDAQGIYAGIIWINGALLEKEVIKEDEAEETANGIFEHMSECAHNAKGDDLSALKQSITDALKAQPWADKGDVPDDVFDSLAEAGSQFFNTLIKMASKDESTSKEDELKNVSDFFLELASHKLEEDAFHDQFLEGLDTH